MRAEKTDTHAKPSNMLEESLKGLSGLGDTLGPIGLTYSGGVQVTERPGSSNRGEGEASTSEPQSISRMSTAEWREKFETDGMVDLWLEDEYNAGSRLVGGRAVHWGGMYGFGTGEGPTAGDVATHKVKIFNHYNGQEIDVEVPEDRYILFEAEDQGLELPYACRMGCCTACAVKVVEGSVYQPQALGVSEELRKQGYALMCVGFPESDCVLQTVPEDEVYDLQFGRYFAAQALDPTAPTIERDDFALEIAQMDE